MIDLGNLAPIEEQYKIGDAVYTLRELSEDGRAMYMDEVAKGAKLDPANKKVEITGSIGGADSLLVSLCLYRDDVLMPRDEVRKWPGRIVSVLAAAAKRISGLEGDDASKKPSGGTAPTSS